MAVNATRSVDIVYSGGVVGTQQLAAAANATSPARIDFITLASGANTITPPAGFASATIVPPPANAVSIILKGVTGDTGVRLHNTDPTSIALDSGVTSFCLTAAGSIAGVRIFWT